MMQSAQNWSAMNVSGPALLSSIWFYPMVRVSATRLNCFPMYTEKADDAALTLPISPPLSKSWAPCRVMFSGGFAPRKKSVTHSWAVFCSVVPQLTRFTLE